MNSRGIGGAANWKGSEHERGAAAYLASHCLAAEALRQLDFQEQAIPQHIRLQADDPVDDIVCRLSNGGHLYVQARSTLNFRSHRSTGLRWVADQWVEQMKATGLDPKQDRVVALAHRVSPDVEILQSALDRLRQNGAANVDGVEREQLDRLEKCLGNLSPKDRARLLRCAQIWVMRVSDELEAATAQCRQMLGARVVPENHRDAAWERLLNVCGKGARLRYGFDRQQLCDALRGTELPLREDEPGSTGASRGAMARYLERVQRRGETLDFAGLAATIPPLTLERADAEVEVSPGGPGTFEEERYGDPLTWALRRRGRVLLTGLPGSGKSTALRAVAAEYAKRPGWPLPIVVRLDMLSKRLGEHGVRKALVELATSSASGMDRKVLASQLDDALNGPGIVLVLDALDEARAGRHEVLRQLKDFFSELDPDAEIVVATRDLAYADAASLGFFELRLLAPRESLTTARAVLEELAPRFAPADGEDWVNARINWVEQWLARDKALAETPLLAVLLAMRAAVGDEETLPGNRATVMVEILDAVIVQWEANGERAQVGTLPEGFARRALVEGFLTLSRMLTEQELPVIDECRHGVANALREGFELTAPSADVCAEDVIAFWDQAGFFVCGSDGRLFPRLRLFVEVGEAWRASKLTDAERSEWVDAVLADPDLTETLRLACQLSPRLTREVIDVAAANCIPDLVLRANAVTAGASGQRASKRNLLAGALIKVLNSDDQSKRRAAAEALLDFDLPKKLRDETRRSLASLPADQRPSFEALLALKAKPPGAAEKRAIRSVIDTDPPEREKPGGPRGAFVLALASTDPIWSRAIHHSLERLLPKDPSLATRALHLVEEVGGRHADALEVLLRRFANQEIVADLDRRRDERYGGIARARRFVGELKLRHEADREFLRWLTTAADPIDLRAGQRRRLDELVNLWSTLGLPDAPAYAPSNTLQAAPKTLHECMLVLARLSGVDLALIASEAAYVLEEGDRHPEDREELESMLNMKGAVLTFDAWNRVEDRLATRRLLHRALSLGSWFSWRAIQALANSGMEESDIEEIVELLPRLRRMSRFEAARLVLSVEDTKRVTEWLNEDDIWLRNAAAWRIAAGVQSGEPPTLLSEVLSDPDDEVRTTMIESLEAPLSKDVRATLLDADRDPRPWTCMRCEQENPATNAGCESCHVVGGDFASKLAKLLKDDGPNK